MNGSKSDLKERFEAVARRIRDAEERWNRPLGSVHLVGASKKQPAASIATLADLGLRAVGENYLQEAISKQDALPTTHIEWHFIGSIQANKTKILAQRFDWIHSVDRLKIANRLGSQRADDTDPVNICLQVNPDLELSKSGSSMNDLAELSAVIAELEGIRLRGLMAIPAPRENFDAQRRCFAEIREALESLNQNLGLGLDTLSMGMSGDLEAAIAEGATHVRIGTALFGPRPTAV